MPIMPLSCVRNVKNVKALWEWLKYWLFVWDMFGFEKSDGNRNFGFDLFASVRFRFKTEPKFVFCTSLLMRELEEHASSLVTDWPWLCGKAVYLSAVASINVSFLVFFSLSAGWCVIMIVLCRDWVPFLLWLLFLYYYSYCFLNPRLKNTRRWIKNKEIVVAGMNTNPGGVPT